MKSYSQFLLAFILLAGNAFAASPAQTDTFRTQIQAEQDKKQAFAEVIWQYLKEEPARKRQLIDAANRFYGLAFMEDSASGKLPDTLSVGLIPWQKALAPLRVLGLPPAAETGMKVLEDTLKEAARAQSAVPTVRADAPTKRRLERQQALLAAASALLTVKQQAANLDIRLEEEARRAASGAHLLGAQSLMFPAAKEGEKP